MYFLGWISLVVISLWISVIAFLWAFRSGQFSDQERARFLPLIDIAPLPLVKNPSKLSKEVYALLVIIVIGLLVLSAPIIMSLYRLGGT